MKVTQRHVWIFLLCVMVYHKADGQLAFTVSSSASSDSPVKIEGFATRQARHDSRGPTPVMKNSSQKEVVAVRLKANAIGNYCDTGVRSKVEYEQGLQRVTIRTGETARSNKGLLAPSVLVGMAKDLGSSKTDVSVYVEEVLFADGSNWVKGETDRSIPYLAYTRTTCTNEVTKVAATNVDLARTGDNLIHPTYKMRCSVQDGIAHCTALMRN